MKALKNQTSFQADSHVKTYPSQEKAKESKERGQVFGQRCLELLGYYDPDTHSLKTSQCSFIEDLTESYLILPASGMMRNGRLYRQKMLEHGTYERGFLSFPTPKTMDHAQSLNSGKDTVITESGSFENVRRKDGMRFGASLNEVVKIMPEKINFPTPTVADTFTENLKSTQQTDESKHSVNLSDAVNMPKLYPTKNKDASVLNPDWVEWLMGFPTDWSNIDKDSTKESLSWDEEPDIPRVTKEKTHRINRLKCLGNAVVPQVAELIGKFIK